MKKLTVLQDELAAAAEARNNARSAYYNAPRDATFEGCRQAREREEAALAALKKGIGDFVDGLKGPPSLTNDPYLELLRDAVVYLLREDLRKRG